MRLTSPILALLLSTASAMAVQDPVAGAKDPRMQSTEYTTGQIYVLHLKVGHTMAITLPDDETRNESYGSDSAHLKAAIPAGTNLVFLKPIAVMTAGKSFFIHSQMPDGSSRLYTFQIDVIDSDGDGEDPYTLTIKDPAALIAARRAKQARDDDNARHAELVAAVNNATDTNFKYVLRGWTAGDWNLLPTRQVGDDGTNTHFHFPQANHPNIYVVTPDGKETVADCTPNSATNTTTCHQLSAKWRLRDGDSELCIFNKAYDPVGIGTPSNTSSPYRNRSLRANYQ